MLILWPAIMVLLLLLGAQALLVSGARAHADAAASAGLRAIWDATVIGLDDSTDEGSDPLAGAVVMAMAAHDAVARTASAGDGWRWWTPGSTVVRSDWCHAGADAALRPGTGQPGWVRVDVTGSVFGPFSALWPGRLDTVHASASGPVVLSAVVADDDLEPAFGAPADLALC